MSTIPRRPFYYVWRINMNIFYSGRIKNFELSSVLLSRWSRVAYPSSLSTSRPTSVLPSEIPYIPTKRLSQQDCWLHHPLDEAYPRGSRPFGISFNSRRRSMRDSDQYVPQVLLLTFPTPSGALDVDKDTAELLKNLGFAKLPINVTHVSAQSQERLAKEISYVTYCTELKFLHTTGNQQQIW